MDRRIAEGKIWFGSDESAIPRGISFLDEKSDQVAISVFEQDRKAASTDMRDLMGEILFDNPKDRRVLARWFRLVTDQRKDAIVLDFFAGSGSTGHAVMDLNAADGGHRQYILVQLGEAVDHPDYETIASVARERLRRAGERATHDAGPLGTHLDAGFRVLRIDTTNMAGVLRTPDEAAKDQLELSVESVKAGRLGEDLLFEVLLGWGLELSLPIAAEAVDVYEVFVVDDGALIACFDKQVSLDLVREIASRGPLRAVFRDSGFATDADRINAEQIFRELSPATDVKVI